jgi:rhodanese-related sulfurtransferase
MLKSPEETLKLVEGKENIYIMCRRGNASKEATEFLMNKLSLTNVINVQGGITEYVNKVDPSLPIY